MRAGHYRRMEMRRQRAARKARGIRERQRRWIARIDVDAIAVPEWARRRAVRGLSGSETHVWLRRGDARALEHLDREAGGSPVVTEVEFRYCGVCGRPLIGEEAAARRLSDMGGRTADQLPCSGECYEAAKDKRWIRQRTRG